MSGAGTFPGFAWSRVPWVVAWGAYAAGMAYTLALVPLTAGPPKAAGISVMLLTAVAVGGSLHAGRKGVLDRRTRRAWTLTGVGLAMFLVATVLITVLPRAEFFPSPGDFMRIVAMSTLLAALHTFPLRAAERSERLKVVLDTVIVFAVGMTMIGYFVVAPYAPGHGSVETVVAGAIYPLVDLVLLFMGMRLVLRGANPTTRSPAKLLVCGFLLLAVVDVHQSHAQAVAPGSTRGSGVDVAVVLTAFAALAFAALEQVRAARPAALSTRRDASVSWLPQSTVALCCGLMIVETLRTHGLSRLSGLALGIATVVSLLLVRQFITQHENLTMATTDKLTGLANRAHIDETLARTLELGSRNGQHTGLLLADLNGFKQVNDTFGHAVGDELLVKFAQLLRRCVLGNDVVGRLGGDEFVVILRGDTTEDRARAVVERIARAMSEPLRLGPTVVQPAASIGVAIAVPGDIDPDGLMQRADAAMYADKRRRRTDVTA